LLLDLAGYAPDRDLAAKLAVEPAAGEGAFLTAMVRRLVESCRLRGRPLLDCLDSILAHELDDASAGHARATLQRTLLGLGSTVDEAARLAQHWVRTGDYLIHAPVLPAADFVLGNPPYIRLEEIDQTMLATYRSAYRTMTGRADLYVAFFEAALRQLRHGGACGFICADRWMRNQYGAELRRLITSGYAVETIIEMHYADAFVSDVSAYPAITVIRRAKQGAVVVSSASEDAGRASAPALAASLAAIRANDGHNDTPAGLTATRVEKWFDGPDPWPCASPDRLALLRRLESEFQPLEAGETGTRVTIGVASGLDDVFITRDPDLVEPSRLLPLAMVKDLKGGRLKWSGHYLVDPWTPHGLVDLGQYPRLAAYFERHRALLERRHVAQRNPRQWFRTIDRVEHTLTHKHKLYIPDIKDTIQPVLDDGQTYPHHNLYVIASEGWNIEALGGLLLSAIGQFFVECYGVRVRGGYLRFQAQYLRRIRVPRPSEVSASDQAGLADAFRRRDVAAATRVALRVYRIEHLPGE
jgi:adenine-specific DNA-methyltransferase